MADIAIIGRTVRESARWPDGHVTYLHRLAWCECGWRGTTVMWASKAHWQLRDHQKTCGQGVA